MFSTTRRILGVVGLTGSLVASLQIPGLVTTPARPPEVVSLQTTFALPTSLRYGALSGNDTPVPVQCAYASFVIPAPAPTMAAFQNPRCLDVAEETLTPHPLEVADAETETTSPATTTFALREENIANGQSLLTYARHAKLEAQVIANINGLEPTARLTANQKLTVYDGPVKPYVVKSGDSIWSIARSHRLKMSVLIYLNAMKTTKIFPGMKLFVPHGAIEDNSLARMRTVKWIRRMLEPAYHVLLAKYGRLTSGFGWRNHPVTGRKGFHVGIDIAAPKFTAIKAWKSGVVERAGRLGLMGNCVIIRHPGDFVSIYGHCNEVEVQAGDKVRCGDIIARVGKTGRATGTHLHFAIKRGGHFVNPLKYLGS